MAKYPLSERQTDAILELRLYQLTGLERDKIEAEYLELMKLIAELQGILDSESVLNALIKTELLELRENTTPRRTQIIDDAGDLRMEDVIPNEGCVITVSHLGFIKRTPVADYRPRSAAARASSALKPTRRIAENLFTASTHDYTLFFTRHRPACFAKKIYDIPEGTRTSKGKSVSSFLRLAAEKRSLHAVREGVLVRPVRRLGHARRHD